jgi:hypothetical protein
MSYYDYHAVLKNASLAQKLWHIAKDDDTIPNTLFINYKEGYKKGGVRKKHDHRWETDPNKRSATWFFQQLADLNESADDDVLTREAAIDLLRRHFQKVEYSKILKNKYLSTFILKEARENELPLKHAVFSLVHNTSPNCPICNDLKHLFNNGLRSTCGSKECICELLSQRAKNRDNSHLWTENARKLAVLTRKENGEWHSEQVKISISESNKKTWNPEKRRLETIKNREAGVYDNMSRLVKNRILNGEFTPNTKNRYTHLKKTNGNSLSIMYRSKWEEKYHLAHPTLEYETIRLPYVYDGITRIYIVDFVDKINKELIEIKPHSLLDCPKVKAKEQAAIEWCEKQGYKYRIITEREYAFT